MHKKQVLCEPFLPFKFYVVVLALLKYGEHKECHFIFLHQECWFSSICTKCYVIARTFVFA
jgi:hypothetical protein